MTTGKKDGATGPPVVLEELDGGTIWQVRLATPKANIIDMEKTGILRSIFDRARDERSLKAIVIEGDGPHFSFGASVEEHLPGKFEAMIRGFHRLFHQLLDSGVPTLAAVRGQRSRAGERDEQELGR